MLVARQEMRLETAGHGDVHDVTDRLAAWLKRVGAGEGVVTVFVPGSTGAVTTIEFEPGAVRDLVEALEAVAPSTRSYHHDQRWGDGNGFSHLRSALLGPSLTIPVADGECVLGTWQQVILVENDLRPRQRRLLFSFVGEGADATSRDGR
jgi:secondary thiamine-phosphate synthase enzyme